MVLAVVVVLAVVLVSSDHEYLFIILNVLFTVQVLLLNLPQGQQLGQLQAQQLNPLWSRVLDLVLMLDLMDAVIRAALWVSAGVIKYATPMVTAVMT